MTNKIAEPTLRNYLTFEGKICSDCPFNEKCLFYDCFGRGMQMLCGYNVIEYIFRCPIGDVSRLFYENAHLFNIKAYCDVSNEFKKTGKWKKWQKWLQQRQQEAEQIKIGQEKYRNWKQRKIEMGYPSCFGNQVSLGLVGHEDYCDANCPFLDACRRADVPGYTRVGCSGCGRDV